MEREDEVPFETWKQFAAFPSYPRGYIECPLSTDQLAACFSLVQVAPSVLEPNTAYSDQEAAMRAFYTDPPLTKPLPTSSRPFKRAKHTMNPLASPTLETRVRTLREFVGFAYKWLELVPTMELVMHPQVVAKFFGFHAAKGTQEGTLKRLATHLQQATAFVLSPDCPKKKPFLQATIKATLEWYTNLNGKILASISTAYTAREQGTTLWEVWEATTAKWLAFTAKLKVSFHFLLAGFSQQRFPIEACSTQH